MAGPAWAQAEQALPVPGVAAARDVPGAHEMPDPNTEYKVLFDVEAAAPKITDVNPMLQAAARYNNTLGKAGVPASKRKIAVVFHQGGTPAILKSEAFKARNDGQDNPNIAIIQALKKAGVDFRVCGQAVLGMKIDPKDIQPEIQLVIKSVCNNFYEMPPNTIREQTFCCGSGSGLNASENMELRLRGGLPRANAVKHVVQKYRVNMLSCICAIDRAALTASVDYWVPGTRVTGVHEMGGERLSNERGEEANYQSAR